MKAILFKRNQTSLFNEEKPFKYTRIRNRLIIENIENDAF